MLNQRKSKSILPESHTLQCTSEPSPHHPRVGESWCNTCYHTGKIFYLSLLIPLVASTRSDCLLDIREELSPIDCNRLRTVAFVHAWMMRKSSHSQQKCQLHSRDPHRGDGWLWIRTCNSHDRLSFCHCRPFAVILPSKLLRWWDRGSWWGRNLPRRQGLTLIFYSLCRWVGETFVWCRVYHVRW